MFPSTISWTFLFALSWLLKWQEAYDSRIFGPVQMTDIVGRVIYCLQSAVDHGPIKNRWTKFLILFILCGTRDDFLMIYTFYLFSSQFSMAIDFPVLAVELDVDEMAKSHKAWTFCSLTRLFCTYDNSWIPFFSTVPMSSTLLWAKNASEGLVCFLFYVRVIWLRPWKIKFGEGVNWRRSA